MYKPCMSLSKLENLMKSWTNTNFRFLSRFCKLVNIDISFSSMQLTLLEFHSLIVCHNLWKCLHTFMKIPCVSCLSSFSINDIVFWSLDYFFLHKTSVIIWANEIAGFFIFSQSQKPHISRWNRHSLLKEGHISKSKQTIFLSDQRK